MVLKKKLTINEKVHKLLCAIYLHSWREVSHNFYRGNTIFRYKCKYCGKKKIETGL